MRVLVVNADPTVRRALRAELGSRDGFTVVGDAGDADAALLLARDVTPDVVVLDVALSELAGQEVLTRLRDELPGVSTVVYSDTNHRVEGPYGAAPGQSVLVDRLVGILADVDRDATWSVTTEVPADRSGPREARDFVAHHLTRWSCDHLIDDVSLVVSELVANAVFHGSAPIEVGLRLGDGVVRIEVADAGTGTPDPLLSETGQQGGRGLKIVSALVRAWGVRNHDHGKVAWAELSTERMPTA